MSDISVIGLDIAKNVFHLVGCDANGKQIKRKALKRQQVLRFFAQLLPCCVAMEACATSHYWGREIEKLGHQVKAIPPQHVKPYLHGSKNDFNDAAAIAEAATRPRIRPVPIKTEDQQILQAVHRARELAVAERTALSNQIRGILAEFGIVFPKSLARLRKHIAELTAPDSVELRPSLKQLMAKLYRRFKQCDEYVSDLDNDILQHAEQQPECELLRTIPGIGPITASAIYASAGDASEFKRGRDFAASIGLVPKQHSSGGKEVLLGITKRGNSRLRYLLVHGARSLIRHADKKNDALSRWAARLHQTRGYNRAAVALANKLARIACAVLHSGECFTPNYHSA